MVNSVLLTNQQKTYAPESYRNLSALQCSMLLAALAQCRLQISGFNPFALYYSMSGSASHQCGVNDFHGFAREAVLVCAAVASH